jgi:hypothetical protein
LMLSLIMTLLHWAAIAIISTLAAAIDDWYYYAITPRHWLLPLLIISPPPLHWYAIIIAITPLLTDYFATPDISHTPRRHYWYLRHWDCHFARQISLMPRFCRLSAIDFRH